MAATAQAKLGLDSSAIGAEPMSGLADNWQNTVLRRNAIQGETAKRDILTEIPAESAEGGQRRFSVASSILFIGGLSLVLWAGILVGAFHFVG